MKWVEKIRLAWIPTWSRFPMVFGFAVIATILSFLMVGEQITGDRWVKLLLVVVWSVPVTTAATLHAEGRVLVQKTIIYSLGLAALAWLYLYLISVEEMYLGIGILYLIIHIISILFISCTPGFHKKDETHVLHFNAYMLIHTLESLLSSTILFATGSLVIFALYTLFDLEHDGRIYLKFFILVIGLFNTFYLISSIPKEKGTFRSTLDTNRFFRVLSQFILLPITLVFLVILYAYGIKVLGSIQSWVIQWLAEATLWFYALGLLTFLLNKVMQKPLTTSISNWFQKWFFWLSLPLVVMLFYLLFLLYEQGGITPAVYYSSLLNIWMLIVCIYFVATKHQWITAIPLSLIVVGFISIVGPVNMESMVINNQINRIRLAIVSTDLLDEGQLTIPKEPILLETNLQPALSLLDDFNALERLRVLDADGSFFSKEVETTDLLKYIGEQSSDMRYFSYQNEIPKPIDVSEYNDLYTYEYFPGNRTSENDVIRYNGKNALVINYEEQTATVDILETIKASSSNSISPIAIETNELKVAIYFHWVNGNYKSNGEVSVDGFYAYVLVGQI